MDSAPVLPPPRPLFCNIHHRQIQHFQQTVVCRENALGLCDLPQLPIKAFDRVRGIDQTADFLRILEVSTEVGSVFPPRLCNLGIFAVPVLRKSLQSIQSSLLVHGGIHGLQIGHESLQVFVRDIFAGIPQLVNNAVLNLRFRKYCVDGCIKASQIVCTCDENILSPPPFLRPFSTVAQNFALSLSPTHIVSALPKCPPKDLLACPAIDQYTVHIE